jgi:hypothetical protein
MHEEMLNFPGHKENANQNYIQISLHSSQNGYPQDHKQQILPKWGQVGGNESSYTVGENVN